MIGTTIGGYEITDRLAAGGMGEVFTAKHAVMGRAAVVKLLLPELSYNEEMVRRFFNEARAAASINDPGIVQVFDVGYLPDRRAYIVMEKLTGETLAHRLRSRGMTLDHTLNILRLLARTLDAAHAHGIVHRDLKPDNLFLVPDRDIAGGERTKVLDFGIAKLAGGNTQQATRSGSIFGTPAYMAPEQCNDAATVDARADLYAVGCIAYEMLTGQPPFGGGGLELLAAHMRDTPVPVSQRNPAVPPWVEAVVDKLLRKSPGDRYQSAAELFAALDQARMTPSPSGISGTAATMNPPPPISFPSARPPLSQPPLTTHGAAAGFVSTAPPAPASGGRGKLALALGGGAVVAAAVVIAMVARGGGHTDQVAAQPPPPPAPAVVPAPVVTAPAPKPADANLLADAERALAERRWQDAMIAAAAIPKDDAGYPRAQAIIVAARAGDTAPPVVATKKADPKVATKKSPVAPVIAAVAAEPAAPSMGYDDALRQAADAYSGHRWGDTLRFGQLAYQSKQTQEAAFYVTVGACSAKNRGLAAGHLPSQASFREIAIRKCESFGVPLD